jgi:hypothetical protein
MDIINVMVSKITNKHKFLFQTENDVNTINIFAKKKLIFKGTYELIATYDLRNDKEPVTFHNDIYFNDKKIKIIELNDFNKYFKNIIHYHDNKYIDKLIRIISILEPIYIDI